MTAVTQNSLKEKSAEPSVVLHKSFLRAGSALGLTREQLGRVVGKDRTSLSRNERLDPAKKDGELALMMVRVYRSLFALMGGDNRNMQHWMHHHNHHTAGVPAEQVQHVQGLMAVLFYLDAMRGQA